MDHKEITLLSSLVLNCILVDYGILWKNNVIQFGDINISFHFTKFPEYSNFSEKLSRSVAGFKWVSDKFYGNFLFGVYTLSFDNTPEASLSQDVY